MSAWGIAATLGAVAVAGFGGAAAADGGAPTATLQPVELVFAADEAGAGSSEILRGMTDAAATRAAAATACFDKKKMTEANALALVVVSKAGKTTRVAVAGSGDAGVDKCLEKAIKPTAWPATSRGGALALSIVNTARRTAPDDDPGEILLKPGTGSVTKSDDAIGRVSTGGSITIGVVSGSTETYVQKVQSLIQARMAGAKRCYATALRKNATLSGALALRLTIGGDGAVVAASPNPSQGAELDDCMVTWAKGIRFAAPPDGNAVDLNLPFNMTP